MSERFIRCAHCGLPHDAHVAVCPTTGLRIDQQAGEARRRRRATTSRDMSREQQRMLGVVVDEKYRVVAAIGEGGMSSIYQAVHLSLQRHVALKVLHPALADDPEAIARLQQEAQVVAAIGHPNICEVFDLGRTADGSPYLVMELLVGETLAERLKTAGPMPFLRLAPLLRQVLAALDAAHGKGILHRDLKPENVFIEEPKRIGKPTAKLLDFGISKSMSYDFIEHQRLTHTGMVMGTPYYMAPEQARGDSGLDQRVDLWAIGVMMYEAMTGRRPFVATNYNALLVKILTSRPRPAQKVSNSVTDDVAVIIDRALSKLREDRFQTAREFAGAILAAERAHTSHDPQASAVMMKRPQLPVPAAVETRPERPRGTDWAQAIDDPSTFRDDETPYDPAPAQAHGIPRVALEQPPPGTLYSWDDDEPEPIEPTIQDRLLPLEDWEEESTLEPQPLHAASTDDGGDTEVIGRDQLHLESLDAEAETTAPLSDNVSASFADSQHDTEVIARDVVLAEADRARAELAAAAAAAAEPGPSKARTRPGPPVQRAAPAGAVRPSPTEPPRPRARRPPRPRPIPEDEEKTTLYDAEAARKKLLQRRDEGQNHAADEAPPDSGGVPQPER